MEEAKRHSGIRKGTVPGIAADGAHVDIQSILSVVIPQ